MDAFRHYISQYTRINDKDWEIIKACIQLKSIDKGVVLLKEGEICKHVYFLESGLLRYFMNHDGNDITKFFTVAPYVFTSQFSFNHNIPSAESIEALESSVIYKITKSDTQMLMKIDAWKEFVLKLVQEVEFYVEQILVATKTSTAEERYKNMLLNDNTLLQRVPLKHIASYLGIAPQSLSRIRKNINLVYKS